VGVSVGVDVGGGGVGVNVAVAVAVKVSVGVEVFVGAGAYPWRKIRGFNQIASSSLGVPFVVTTRMNFKVSPARLPRLTSKG